MSKSKIKNQNHLTAKSPKLSCKAHANYTEARAQFLEDARDYVVIEDNIIVFNTIIEEHVMLRRYPTIKDVVLPKANYFVFEDNVVLRITNQATTLVLPVLSRKEVEGEQPLAIVGRYPRPHLRQPAQVGMLRGIRTNTGAFEKVRLTDAQGLTIREDILRSGQIKGSGEGIDLAASFRPMSFDELDIVWALLEAGMFRELTDYMDEWMYNNSGN